MASTFAHNRRVYRRRINIIIFFTACFTFWRLIVTGQSTGSDGQNISGQFHTPSRILPRKPVLDCVHNPYQYHCTRGPFAQKEPPPPFKPVVANKVPHKNEEASKSEAAIQPPLIKSPRGDSQQLIASDFADRSSINTTPEEEEDEEESSLERIAVDHKGTGQGQWAKKASDIKKIEDTAAAPPPVQEATGAKGQTFPTYAEYQNLKENAEALPDILHLPFQDTVADVVLKGWEDRWISEVTYDVKEWGKLEEPKIDFVYTCKCCHEPCDSICSFF